MDHSDSLHIKHNSAPFGVQIIQMIRFSWLICSQCLGVRCFCLFLRAILVPIHIFLRNIKFVSVTNAFDLILL